MKQIPSLWYPMGAGGMWLNYAVWCGLNQKNIPGTHVHFEFLYLKSLDTTYREYFNFNRHLTRPIDSPVRLGSDRAWLNFFSNIIYKKGHYPGWKISGPAGFFEWRRQNIKCNLDWCAIFEDPEKFFEQVAKLTGYSIKLDQYTEMARKQYVQSCVNAESAEVLESWRNYIFTNIANTTDSDDIRQQQVRQILNETWFDIKNSRGFLRS